MGLERRRGWHDSQISLSALDETDPLFDLVVSGTESPHSEHWPVAKASKLVRSMLSHDYSPTVGARVGSLFSALLPSTRIQNVGRETDSNVCVITDSLSFFVVSDSSSTSS